MTVGRCLLRQRPVRSRACLVLLDVHPESKGEFRLAIAQVPKP
jgi:hypothetical protein